jgi:BirA family biotin operon repressor/biotin-[acetyl-CoA-carboxylase] ligase
MTDPVSHPDPPLAEALEAATTGLRFGRPLHTYRSLGSTNEVATLLAESGAPEGTLVTAEEQTRGKGRHGRLWHSPRGGGIWMSLVLRPDSKPDRAAGLPLLGAVAVTAAIHGHTGAPAAIKWPNDVIVDGLKVAGVLGESVLEGEAVRYAIIGIGINVNLNQDELPEKLRHTACSLLSVTGRPWRRTELASCVLREFERRYDAYEAGDAAGLLAELREFSGLIGRTVRLESGGQAVTGTVVDLGPDGALHLTTAAGPLSFRVGEASLRIA